MANVIRSANVSTDKRGNSRLARIVNIFHKPADCGVVVVRAGVGDRIFRRNKTDSPILVEVQFKMQNLHAREAAILSEFFNRVCNNSQIFGDNLPVGKFALNHIEKRSAGPFNPFAVNRSFCVAVNRPVRLKASEMVNANNVNKVIKLFEAKFPPFVIVFFHCRPIVQRISPKLTGRAEIIGRNSRNFFGSAFLVKLEKFLISPSVRAVRRNENRHIAHNLNSALTGVSVQFMPLAMENILLKLNIQNFVGEFSFDFFHRVFFAVFQILVPLDPVNIIIFRFNRRKNRVIFQPIRFICAELVEVRF